SCRAFFIKYSSVQTVSVIAVVNCNGCKSSKITNYIVNLCFHKYLMSGNLLSHIQTPDDLRKLDISQLPQLAQELRDFIMDVVSVKEGHLGASLGVVELTIALHYIFNTPQDLLVWDV